MRNDAKNITARSCLRPALLILSGFVTLILVTALFLDLGIRYLEYTGRLLPVSKCVQFGTRMGISFRPNCREEVVDYTGNKTVVEFNADGLIGSPPPSTAEKKRGQFNVLLIGDCNLEDRTQGDPSKKVDMLLKDAVAKSKLPIRIFNAALDGASLQVLKIILEEKVDLGKFDLVLLPFSRVFAFHQYFDKKKTRTIDGKDWIIKVSSLHRIIGDRVYFFLARHTNIPRAVFFIESYLDYFHARFFLPPEEIPELFLADLADFRSRIQEKGPRLIPLFLRTLPHSEELDPPNPILEPKERKIVITSASFHFTLFQGERGARLQNYLEQAMERMRISKLDIWVPKQFQTSILGKFSGQQSKLLANALSELVFKAYADVNGSRKKIQGL